MSGIPTEMSERVDVARASNGMNIGWGMEGDKMLSLFKKQNNTVC